MKLACALIALAISLTACSRDTSSTEAAPPPAENPQALPLTDANGQVIPGTTVWSGTGRRACVVADRQLIHNVRRDLKAIEADTQVGWVQGRSGRHHRDISYLTLATNRAERGIQECNRIKAEIQFSSCQMVDVNHAYEKLSHQCDQLWETRARLVEALK